MKILNTIHNFIKITYLYRCGTCYKLYDDGIRLVFCIQKDNCFGNFRNIYETDNEKDWSDKVNEMKKNGIKFEI